MILRVGKNEAVKKEQPKRGAIVSQPIEKRGENTTKIIYIKKLPNI